MNGEEDSGSRLYSNRTLTHDIKSKSYCVTSGFHIARFRIDEPYGMSFT